MHLKKLLLTIFCAIAAAVFLLFMMPVQRTYQAEVIVNANEQITSRTLMDTLNWSAWYTDRDGESITITKAVTKKQFGYFISGSLMDVKGNIELQEKNKWNTVIRWSETLVSGKTLSDKVKLLLFPSRYRSSFTKAMVHFKSYLENPDERMAGIKFEMQSRETASYLAIVTDTLTAGNVTTNVPLLYLYLKNSIPGNIVTEPDFYYSQIEKLEGEMLELKVAIKINESDIKANPDIEIFEQDPHEIVRMHTSGDFQHINEDVTIMYEWLKSKNVRPAATYWVQHNTEDLRMVASKNSPLTIIQEIYRIAN